MATNNENKKSITTITLQGGKPWGFRIIGGNDMSISLQIQQVLSSKAKSVGLEKGDKIHAINDKSTTSLSHNEAKNLIIEAGDTLKLSIEKNSIPYTSSQKTSLSTAPLQDDRAMFSVPSRTVSTSISNRGSTTNELPPPSSTKKVEIKPKIDIDSDKSTAKTTTTTTKNNKLEPLDIKPNTTEKSTNDNINEVTGLSRSTDIKSPFLKNMIIEGVDNMDRSEKPNIINIKPPTAQYTPPVSVPSSTTTTTTTTTNIITSTGTKPKIDPDNTDNHKSPMENKQDEKICSKCNEIIKDTSYISASNRYYHKLHFTCEHCNSALTGKAYFEDKDNKICCQLCVNKGSTGKCNKCDKAIFGSFLTVGKDSYHDECFVCVNCRKSLKNEQFILLDGKPCCENCNEELNSTYCVKCKKPIKPGESFIEVENGNCHSKCFTCKICKAVLTSFKMRDGYAICPKH